MGAAEDVVLGYGCQYVQVYCKNKMWGWCGGGRGVRMCCQYVQVHCKKIEMGMVR